MKLRRALLLALVVGACAPPSSEAPTSPHDPDARCKSSPWTDFPAIAASRRVFGFACEGAQACRGKGWSARAVPNALDPLPGVADVEEVSCPENEPDADCLVVRVTPCTTSFATIVDVAAAHAGNKALGLAYEVIGMRARSARAGMPIAANNTCVTSDECVSSDRNGENGKCWPVSWGAYFTIETEPRRDLNGPRSCRCWHGECAFVAERGILRSYVEP